MATRILVLAVSLLAAQHVRAETREFPRHQCTLTLPSDAWDWEPTRAMVAQAVAAMSLGEELLLTLRVQLVKRGTNLDEAFIRESEAVLLSDGSVRKLSERRLTFKGLPCYELTVVAEELGAATTTRVLIEHDTAYALSLTCPIEQAGEHPKADEAFGAFAFAEFPLEAQRPPTMTFPEHGCKFTLPSGAWRWENDLKRVHVCITHESGLVLMLRVKPVPPGAEVNEASMAVYEESAIAEEKATKLRGDFITYKGARCYQLQMKRPGAKTRMVSRVFIANGKAYSFSLLGVPNIAGLPPEAKAAFDAFELVSPPVNSKAWREQGERERRDIMARNVRFAFYCLLAAAVLWVAKKLRRG
jgi:hypothetical protein